MADGGSDYSWIGPVIKGVAGAAGSQQAVAGQQQNSELLKAIYDRAIKMLESGELGYNPQQIAGISTPVGDVRAKLAQNDALTRLQEASREGYNVVDRAAMNRTMNEANANAKSQTEAALARLDPNSGAAASARIQAQQSAANRASQQSMDAAAGSRLKALQALGAYGNLATNMRDRAFDEANGIDKFNADIARWNAGAANTAAQQGITNRIGVLGSVSGAGKDYGSALAQTGLMQGRQTKGVGDALGSGFEATDEDKKEKGGK